MKKNTFNYFMEHSNPVKRAEHIASTRNLSNEDILAHTRKIKGALKQIYYSFLNNKHSDHEIAVVENDVVTINIINNKITAPFQIVQVDINFCTYINFLVIGNLSTIFHMIETELAKIELSFS